MKIPDFYDSSTQYPAQEVEAPCPECGTLMAAQFFIGEPSDKTTVCKKCKEVFAIRLPVRPALRDREKVRPANTMNVEKS